MPGDARYASNEYERARLLAECPGNCDVNGEDVAVHRKGFAIGGLGPPKRAGEP
jgi:hypothetical protein